MIRITGGALRGRRIAVPRDARPTTEVARKAAFDILGPRIEGTRVLDAAAGSGAYGLEALSRGAREAVFVESDRWALRVLRENVAALALAERATVVPLAVSAFLAGRCREAPFDVVFFDPPYAADVAADLEGLLGRLASGGALFLERGDDIDPSPPGWPPADKRRYGSTRLLVFRR